MKFDQQIKQSICHRFAFRSREVFSSLFIITISIFDLKIMARREYHVVLFLNVFVDCCFSFIPISLTVLLYCISNTLAVHPNTDSATTAATKKRKASKSKSPSKKGKQKAVAVEGRTSTRTATDSTTAAAKAKKTKPALAKRNTTAAATTTATSMKRKPGEKKRKEPSPSKLCSS